MPDKESQPCNKCNCPIIWDFSIDPPPATKRTKKGWWREDLSKEIHTLDRCTNFRNSQEFKEEHAVHNAQANPNVKDAPSPVREMDASDFAEKPMRQEIKTHMKFLSIIEDEVKKNLKDDNPAKVGMYMKLIMEMLDKK